MSRWEDSDLLYVPAPDMLAAAATDVASIGSSLSAANAVAVGPTTGDGSRRSRVRMRFRLQRGRCIGGARLDEGVVAQIVEDWAAPFGQRGR